MLKDRKIKPFAKQFLNRELRETALKQVKVTNKKTSPFKALSVQVALYFQSIFKQTKYQANVMV